MKSINSYVLAIIVITCFADVGCRTFSSTNGATQGVFYEVITTNTGAAHVATVDLERADLRIVHSPTRNELVEPSKLAEANRAIIAINAGFFGADGSFVGAVKINGHWLSRPHPFKLRGVMGFDRVHGIVFDRLVRNDDIISNSEENFAKPGWWNEFDNVIAGAPLLLVNGKKVDPLPEQTLSTFLTDRYARSAICHAGNSIVKLVVLDGGDRKANFVSEPKGMTIDELADFLLSLGCTHALNLDGGYSTSFIAFGKRRNQFNVALPERPVANILVVVPRS